MIGKSDNFIKSELANFSQLAQDWWNPLGKLKPLHVINPLRLSYITRRTHLENKRVLDIGCGGGLLAEAMAAMSAQVTGIDMSDELIDIAKQHAVDSGTNVEYHVTTIEDFASNNDVKFDVITCMEMLEHVPNPDLIINSATKLLNADGHLFLSTINRTLKSYFGMIIGAEYLLRLIPRHTHHYSQFIRPHELVEWLRDAGMTAEDISGIKYIPFIDYASLADDISVNYIAHAKAAR